MEETIKQNVFTSMANKINHRVFLAICGWHLAILLWMDKPIADAAMVIGFFAGIILLIDIAVLAIRDKRGDLTPAAALVVVVIQVALALMCLSTAKAYLGVGALFIYLALIWLFEHKYDTVYDEQTKQEIVSYLVSPHLAGGTLLFLFFTTLVILLYKFSGVFFLALAIPFYFFLRKLTIGFPELLLGIAIYFTMSGLMHPTQKQLDFVRNFGFDLRTAYMSKEGKAKAVELDKTAQQKLTDAVNNYYFVREVMRKQKGEQQYVNRVESVAAAQLIGYNPADTVMVAQMTEYINLLHRESIKIKYDVTSIMFPQIHSVFGMGVDGLRGNYASFQPHKIPAMVDEKVRQMYDYTVETLEYALVLLDEKTTNKEILDFQKKAGTYVEKTKTIIKDQTTIAAIRKIISDKALKKAIIRKSIAESYDKITVSVLQSVYDNINQHFGIVPNEKIVYWQHGTKYINEGKKNALIGIMELTYQTMTDTASPIASSILQTFKENDLASGTKFSGEDMRVIGARAFATSMYYIYDAIQKSDDKEYILAYLHQKEYPLMLVCDIMQMHYYEVMTALR